MCSNHASTVVLELWIDGGSMLKNPHIIDVSSYQLGVAQTSVRSQRRRPLLDRLFTELLYEQRIKELRCAFGDRCRPLRVITGSRCLAIVGVQMFGITKSIDSCLVQVHVLTGISIMISNAVIITMLLEPTQQEHFYN